MFKVSSLCLLLAYIHCSLSYNGEVVRIDEAGLIIKEDKCSYPCSLKQKRNSQPGKKSHTLQALDCRFPKSIKSGLLEQICNRDQEVQQAEAKEVLLLQYSKRQVVKAVRCQRRETRLNAICGAFSHNKLLEPPDILIPAMFTVQDCATAVHTGLYTEESGRALPVQVNQRYHYKYVAHGSLTASTDNVQCTGGEIIVHGEVHRSLLTLVTVELEITEVSLEVYPNGTYQSSKCTDSQQCQDGLTAYVLRKELNTCPLFIIRTLLMYPVNVQTTEGKKAGWVSEEHKLLLVEGRRGIAPSSCGPVTTVIHTNFKNLKIVMKEKWMSELRHVAHTLGPSELDLDLELRTSADYMTYNMEQMVKNKMLHMGSNLCKMNRHSLNTAEISPFHINSLLRIRGEVVSELECTPVTVSVREGDRRTFCTADSLPAWLGNEPVHVQAGTHLVVSDSQMAQIPCTGRYPAVFRVDSGVLLQANPVVTVVNLSLTHIESEYAHLLPDEDVHHGDTGDLLYTSDEVEEFNSMVHYSRTKDQVLDALVSKYCESGDCGSYKPGAQSSYFNLDKLKDTIEHPFAWVGEYRRKLSEIGGYCSILILLFLIIKFLMKVYQLLSLRLRKKLPFVQAASYAFLLDKQRKQDLVDAAQQARSTGYPVSAPAPPVVEFKTIAEEKQRLGRTNHAASAPMEDELQALLEENRSTSEMPVARKRHLNSEVVDVGAKVKGADSQQDVDVEDQPPHPRNWLREM